MPNPHDPSPDVEAPTANELQGTVDDLREQLRVTTDALAKESATAREIVADAERLQATNEAHEHSIRHLTYALDDLRKARDGAVAMASAAQSERDVLRVRCATETDKVLEVTRRLATAEAEAKGHDKLTARMSDLLKGVANGLLGDPGPLKQHDWSRLPELAAQAGSYLMPVGEHPDNALVMRVADCNITEELADLRKEAFREHTRRCFDCASALGTADSLRGCAVAQLLLRGAP